MASSNYIVLAVLIGFVTLAGTLACFCPTPTPSPQNWNLTTSFNNSNFNQNQTGQFNSTLAATEDSSFVGGIWHSIQNFLCSSGGATPGYGSTGSDIPSSGGGLYNFYLGLGPSPGQFPHASGSSRQGPERFGGGNQGPQLPQRFGSGWGGNQGPQPPQRFGGGLGGNQGHQPPQRFGGGLGGNQGHQPPQRFGSGNQGRQPPQRFGGGGNQGHQRFGGAG